MPYFGRHIWSGLGLQKFQLTLRRIWFTRPLRDLASLVKIKKICIMQLLWGYLSKGWICFKPVFYIWTFIFGGGRAPGKCSWPSKGIGFKQPLTSYVSLSKNNENNTKLWWGYLFRGWLTPRISYIDLYIWWGWGQIESSQNKRNFIHYRCDGQNFQGLANTLYPIIGPLYLMGMWP